MAESPAAPWIGVDFGFLAHGRRVEGVSRLDDNIHAELSSQKVAFSTIMVILPFPQG
jgi:hypothetical protein